MQLQFIVDGTIALQGSVAAYAKCVGMLNIYLAAKLFMDLPVIFNRLRFDIIMVMSRLVATPLRKLICHMGSHSVTCQPAELTFPPLPQPKLVLD